MCSPESVSVAQWLESLLLYARRGFKSQVAGVDFDRGRWTEERSHDCGLNAMMAVKLIDMRSLCEYMLCEDVFCIIIIINSDKGERKKVWGLSSCS